MASVQQPRPLASGVNAAAPYVKRPPSPPFIPIPTVGQLGTHNVTIKLVLDGVNLNLLSAADLAIITANGKAQVALDHTDKWRYDDRYKAHPILDFLYLGPSSVLKDRTFLAEAGITMILGVRDSRLAQARFMRAAQTARDLGLQAEYVDVASNAELLRACGQAVALVNGHMLDVHRRALAAGEGEGAKRGRVLMFCETGNERSAAIAAAYIMTVYGADMVRAVQFVSIARFCANIDDKAKNWLQSYDDILNAKRAVYRGAEESHSEGSGESGGAARSGKRGIEDTMDVDEESDGDFELDRDRYVGRQFAPFVQEDPPDKVSFEEIEDMEV